MYLSLTAFEEEVVAVVAFAVVVVVGKPWMTFGRNVVVVVVGKKRPHSFDDVADHQVGKILMTLRHYVGVVGKTLRHYVVVV